MKNTGSKILALTLIFALVLTSAIPLMVNAEITVVETEPVANSEKTILYVATNGNDENNGTIDSPFATVEKARDTIRQLKADNTLGEGGAVVYLRGGTYKIDKTIFIGKEDSGSENAPIIYRNYPGEDVEFVGGLKVDFNSFKKVTDERTLERIIDESARDKVLSINLFDLGLTKIPESIMPGSYTYWADVLAAVPGLKEPSAQGYELVVNGKGQTVARYPNDKALTIGEVVVQRSFETNTPFVISLNDERTAYWGKARDAVLTGSFAYAWASESVPIGDVDTKKLRIEAKWPSHYEANIGQQVWVYNLIEEIDTPGEYFIDKKTGELYYYPIEETIDEVYITTLGETMIELNYCDYVTFKGIDLKYMRAGAVAFSGANNCKLIDSEVTFTGKTSCSVYGKNNQILDCYFHDAERGVDLSSADIKGTVGNLIPNNNLVENSKFERCERITPTYSDCIVLGSSGNSARHNELSDSSHLLARMSGVNNLYEYNEFYNACYNTDDMGALYTGRNLTHRGNAVKNNYFHDIGGTDRGSNGTHGIFFDDWWSAADVTGNVFADITGYGIMASGSHNVFDNNLFVNCGKGSLNLNRSFNYGNADNFTVYVDGVNSLKEYWNEEVWLDAFPTMANVINEKGEPDMNNYIVATDNVMVNTELPLVSEQVAKTITNEDNNKYSGDIGFVDLENKNYTLKEDSVVFKDNAEFEPIEFEKMGRYGEKALARVENAYVYCIGSAWKIANGKIEKSPRNGAILENGVVYLPVRDAVEAAGGTITYNEETEVIEITADGKTYVFTDGDIDKVKVDGVETTLENPILNIDFVNYVSAKEFAKMFGNHYVGSKGIIIISAEKDLFDLERDKEMLRYLEEIITVY